MCRDEKTADSSKSLDPDGPVWDDRRLDAPHDQPDKARRVRRMFDAIAPTYESVNRLTSFGRDAYWRRRAVAAADVKRGQAVLDVACGTGDLSRAFAARAGSVVGIDFAERMLALAADRGGTTVDGAPLRWCRADALALPFDDGTFDVACCAFGVRNFQDLGAGLREMRRVLRPGGRAVIVEFSMPGNALLRRVYGTYFHRVLPWLATAVSGDRTGAYRYLPRSVVGFVGRDEMAARLRDAGFRRVTVSSLTLGVVALYVAEKDA